MYSVFLDFGNRSPLGNVYNILDGELLEGFLQIYSQLLIVIDILIGYSFNYNNKSSILYIFLRFKHSINYHSRF